MSRSLLVRLIRSIALALALATLLAGSSVASAAPMKSPAKQGTIPQRRADLKITKAGERSGSTITFTLRVENAGPSAAQAVTVVDRLPREVTFVSAQTTSGLCTQARLQALVTCNLGNMEVGQVVEVTIVTTLRPNVRATYVRNIAGVLSRTRDPQPRNNIATAIVRLRNR